MIISDELMNEFSPSYFKLYNKKVEVVTSYNKNKLCVGRKLVKEYVGKYSKRTCSYVKKLELVEGGKFYFDFSQGFRMVLIAPVSSGKTFVIRSICDRAYASNSYHIALLSDVKNEYKCVDINTKIITNNGNKKIKELDEKKDKVLSRNFNNGKNEYKNFKKSNVKIDDVYEVEFEDGSKVLMTNEHKLFYKNGDEVKLKDVKEKQEVISL